MGLIQHCVQLLPFEMVLHDAEAALDWVELRRVSDIHNALHPKLLEFVACLVGAMEASPIEKEGERSSAHLDPCLLRKLDELCAVHLICVGRDVDKTPLCGDEGHSPNCPYVDVFELDLVRVVHRRELRLVVGTASKDRLVAVDDLQVVGQCRAKDGPARLNFDEVARGLHVGWQFVLANLFPRDLVVLVDAC